MADPIKTPESIGWLLVTGMVTLDLPKHCITKSKTQHVVLMQCKCLYCVCVHECANDGDVSAYAFLLRVHNGLETGSALVGKQGTDLLFLVCAA